MPRYSLDGTFGWNCARRLETPSVKRQGVRCRWTFAPTTPLERTQHAPAITTTPGCPNPRCPTRLTDRFGSESSGRGRHTAMAASPSRRGGGHMQATATSGALYSPSRPQSVAWSVPSPGNEAISVAASHMTADTEALLAQQAQMMQVRSPLAQSIAPSPLTGNVAEIGPPFSVSCMNIGVSVKRMRCSLCCTGLGADALRAE